MLYQKCPRCKTGFIRRDDLTCNLCSREYKLIPVIDENERIKVITLSRKNDLNAMAWRKNIPTIPNGN